jgi:hypothetical protein
VTHIAEADAAARFSLASPEAKSLKLKVIQRHRLKRPIQTNSLQAGDKVMICDAGGATIDLTTYTIKRLEPLQFFEFVTPLSKTLQTPQATNLLIIFQQDLAER